ICGGDVCNPEIATSCPDPEICEKTPYGNWRCSCPADLGWRDPHTGACKIGTRPAPTSESHDECNPAQQNTCGPNAKCIRGPEGEFICQCMAMCETPSPTNANHLELVTHLSPIPAMLGKRRSACEGPIQKIKSSPEMFNSLNNRLYVLVIDECSAGTHDCDVNARCTDTDESFICTCNPGFLDKSPDQTRKPGRVCTQLRNECLENRHNCSVNADCIDLADGFLCRCKEGFVDVSPNIKVFAGLECRALVDECASKTLNTCHEHAICIDTRDAYKCQCKEGYVDHDELRNPGRDCRKINQLCESGRHDCDKNAQCIERGTNDYECVCKPGFLDRSPLPHRPGGFINVLFINLNLRPYILFELSFHSSPYKIVALKI
ncbi:unnamed protein product, partial [Strongylus vulgaris]